MQPAEGCVTTADGLRLFYKKLGDGPTTVVVPNGTYMADDFAPLADRRTFFFYDVRHQDATHEK